MAELEKKVRSVATDGLLWGSCAFLLLEGSNLMYYDLFLFL